MLRNGLDGESETLSLSTKYLKISGTPHTFSGTVRLPPSKSYLHRALFVSGLCATRSRVTNCGKGTNEDITATIGALRVLGESLRFSTSFGGSYSILAGSPKDKKLDLNAGGSGTTARFLIPYSSLTPSGTVVKILGNESLSKRPMETVFEPLSDLGVTVKSIGGDGRLPIEVGGGGIDGGECKIDGSVSSQFLSGLLISCVRARKSTVISIQNPEAQVSAPYIEATLQVLRAFGFKIEVARTGTKKYSFFKVPGNQLAPGRSFVVPGDMSSAAALIGASVAAKGRIRLTNCSYKTFPQPDASILEIVRKFGAKIQESGKSISVFSPKNTPRNKISLDLKESPDLVPAVAGLAAATKTVISIHNVEHLRFKESDRISVLARELSKLGVRTSETKSSIGLRPNRKETDSKDNILICPEGDHRMLMALTIAAFSGHFGKVYIRDPDCVKKSYPTFVRDLQRLCHNRSSLKIVRAIEKESEKA
jgi:3-phosphoshikimate 1-carboxyvinyltransferase